MKEFVFLIKEGLEIPDSNFDFQEMESAYVNWMNKLIDEGKYVHGSRLENVSKKLTPSGEIISDGPFVEPKEIIGGIVIVKEEDLDKAVKLAKTCPMSALHQIEVRKTTHDYPA